LHPDAKRLAIERKTADPSRSRQTETMTGPREPKKSETLEVRLPHEVKRALMDKAHAEGRSASDIVRGSIDSYLAQQVKEKRSMIALWKPAAVLGATATAALWAALASAPLHAKVDLKAAFEALDANRDGVISAEEFVAHKVDPSMMEKMRAMHAAAAHKPIKHSPEQLRAHFAEIDSNRNGSITLAEFQAFHDRMARSHVKS